MMRHIRSLLLPLALSLPVAAHADIEIIDPYVRGLPPGVANTAAYMTLRNTGASNVDLVAVHSDIAANTMLHSTMNHEGMLHMVHVDKVSIPAGGEARLASGGLHIMLMQLREHPAPGSSVPLLLQFSDGSELQVAAPVRSVLDE